MLFPFGHAEGCRRRRLACVGCVGVGCVGVVCAQTNGLEEKERQPPLRDIPMAAPWCMVSCRRGSNLHQANATLNDHN